MATATAAYSEHHVLGSPEKDVVGSVHFKVVGAEILEVRYLSEPHKTGDLV